MAIQVKEIAIS